VFLASTTADLNGKRDEIRRELAGKGYEVTPAASLLLDGVFDEEGARQAINSAAVTVHLLGSSYGVIPEGRECSLPHIVLELAEQAGKRRLLWFAKQSALDPKLDSLITKMSDTQDEHSAALDLHQGSFETFKESIVDVLVARPAPGPGVASECRSVYLLFDEADSNNANLRALHRCLVNEGIPVQTPGRGEDYRTKKLIPSGSGRRAPQLRERESCQATL